MMSTKFNEKETVRNIQSSNSNSYSSRISFFPFDFSPGNALIAFSSFPVNFQTIVT